MTISRRYVQGFLPYIVVLYSLTSGIESGPSHRYMPPSWVSMCQSDVYPIQPNSVTSHEIPDVNNAPFQFGSSDSLRNPFLMPGKEFRNKMHSVMNNVGNMATTVPTDQVSSSKATTKMNNITCLISKSSNSRWKLMDLLEWQADNNINAMTSPSNRTVVFSINLRCETGANISLPWPMKSTGLREIHVRNCGLVDQFLLANNSIVSIIPDELRVLDIRDSFWLVDLNSKTSILENSATDFINIDSDYDCGQDQSLEIYISRNVTFTSHERFNKIGVNSTGDDDVENGTRSGKFISGEQTTKRPIGPEDRLITDREALISDRHSIQIEDIPNIDDVIYNPNDTNTLLTNLTAKQDFFELLKKIKNTRIKCDFVKLLVRDESLSSDTPRHLLEVSTQEATHPVLAVLNYSKIGMIEFPRELKQWRLYFPRLEYLDLSHNFISELKVENYPVMPDSPPTIMNIRHNNITKITPDILKSWASVEKFHVDITQNPISCDCDLKDLILFFQDDQMLTGNVKQYEYVKYLHCNSPTSLRGRRLKTLNIDDLPCPSFQSSNGMIIALGVMLGIFVIVTIVLFRFKVEIRILLYTRLHVRLPCDSDSPRNSKLYDAFVSYSNDDSDWVLGNLVNYLEKDTTSIADGISRNDVNKDSNSNPSVWTGGTGSVRQTKSVVGHKGFKLCLHQRDFIPGKTIADNILDSIEASRHTIIVLSPSFMKSHWSMEELRQAYRQSLVEKTRHLIVLLLEKVSDEDMDPLIKRCVKTFTYLQVQDSIFRDKLVFSLSTKDKATRRRDRLVCKQMSSPDSLSHGSKSNHKSSAHDNFAYHHDTPAPQPRVVANKYETVQPTSSTQFPSASQNSNTIINSNEVFQRPDYYSFPSTLSDVPSSSMNDNGYYSLEMPDCAPKNIGNYEYENPVDLNLNTDGLRPDGPSRVLSNSSTSSTTALTWNL